MHKNLNENKSEVPILLIHSGSTPASSSLGWGWFELKIPIIEGCQLKTKLILNTYHRLHNRFTNKTLQDTEQNF